MARSSTVLKLSKPARDAIHEMLQAGATLDDIVEGMAAEFNETVSRSALGRYAQNWREVGKRMRETKEIARAMAAEIGEIPQDKTGQLIVEMFHSMVFRAMADKTESGEVLDPREFMYMAKAIKDSAQAGQSVDRRVAEAKREFAKDIAAKANKAADNAEAIVAEAGLSSATIAKMRKEFLGIRA